MLIMLNCLNSWQIELISFKDEERKVIPEETELSNSKVTVTSSSDEASPQSVGNGKSIEEPKSDKDDATWLL